MFGFKVSRVSGSSLGPKLRDGNVVLFRGRKGVRRGDVVLVEHPELGRIVKKVYAVSRTGDIHLNGVSSSGGKGVDSAVPREAVLGVKVCRLL